MEMLAGELPLISVIVPVYKVEKYLERCVSSIINQSYHELEIILVDDGSPDRCGEMCDAFAREDSRIRVIHKENGGLSDARNAGIERASGEYLAFVDSDDWLDDNMIELLYFILKKHDADIAECSYRNIFQDHIQEETTCTAAQITGDSAFALESMLDWKYFKPVAWNKLYKRSVIGDIRYPKGKLHEDEFTTYQFMYQAKKLIYVDVSKYNYDCTRADSITGANYREENLDCCEALRERVDFFREHELDALEEKMNNTYLWILFDRLDRCVRDGIEGTRIEQIVKKAKNDIDYFKERPVQKNLYNQLIILSNGFEEYKKDYYKRKEQKY